MNFTETKSEYNDEGILLLYGPSRSKHYSSPKVCITEPLVNITISLNVRRLIPSFHYLKISYHNVLDFYFLLFLEKLLNYER